MSENCIIKQNKEGIWVVSSEDYIIKQTEENTWAIINENGEIIDTITKDIVVNYCKNVFEDHSTEHLSADIMIDGVWWHVDFDYDMDFVDHYCQDWDKFTAWFDYICIEYLAQGIVACYKQRLLDFE